MSAGRALCVKIPKGPAQSAFALRLVEPPTFRYGVRQTQISLGIPLDLIELTPKYRSALLVRAQRKMSEGSAKDLFAKNGFFAKNDCHIWGLS